MSFLNAPKDARCPKCGSNDGTTWDLGLPIARLLSWATPQLHALQISCKACRARYSYVHAMPRSVIGYHGCSARFAHELVKNRAAVKEWKPSTNSFDWLGKGIYFWEYAPGRAWQWAKERGESQPAVVAAKIQLGRCLDLGDILFTELLREAYTDLASRNAKLGRTMPTNEGGQQKLRKLDKAVIDILTDKADQRGTAFQTVRSPFEEGDSVYPGGMIKEQSHIQVAVLDPACISSRIFLVDPTEGLS